MRSATENIPNRYAIVQKSPHDESKYRAFKLSNHLDVLLISCPDELKVSASLTVEVGDFQDPPHMPGIAHFLEHMLFMGNARYPDESSFERHLSENFGNCSAETDSEITSYSFNHQLRYIDNPASISVMKESLYRFAQLFISPLFDERSVRREILALESEFRNNFSVDEFRLEDLIRRFVNPHHPFSTFGDGCVKSLTHKSAPFKNYIFQSCKIAQALLQFHSDYYTANLMKVCVQSPYSLDRIEECVTDIFSEIPNRKRKHPTQSYELVPFFSPDYKTVKIVADSLVDAPSLEILWTTPPQRKMHISQAISYVEKLFTSKQRCGLLHLLRSLGWCLDVTTTIRTHLTFCIFNLTIILTDEGTCHIDEIILDVYNYIYKMKDQGVRYTVFTNYKNDSWKSFTSDNYIMDVAQLCTNMHLYKPQYYLTGPPLYKIYLPIQIYKVLDCLNPNKSIVINVCKSKASIMTEESPWYKVAYQFETVKQSTLQKWQEAEKNCPKLNHQEKTSYPQTVLASPVKRGPKHERKPGTNTYLWTQRREEKGQESLINDFTKIEVHLKNEMSSKTALSTTMSQLFASMLKDDLNLQLWPATMAGVEYDIIYEQKNGIYAHVITVSGPKSEVEHVLTCIVDVWNDIDIDSQKLKFHRELIKRTYLLQRVKQVQRQSLCHTRVLLSKPFWHSEKCLEALQTGSITEEKMEAYVKELSDALDFIVWNDSSISSAETSCISDHFRKRLGPLISEQEFAQSQKGSPPTIIKKCREELGSDGENVGPFEMPFGRDIYIRRENSNPYDSNSGVEVLYELCMGDDTECKSMAVVLEVMIHQELFSVLRTREQLGYVVEANLCTTNNIHFLSLFVESSRVGPSVILERIDAFLHHFRKEVLDNMSEDRWLKYAGWRKMLKGKRKQNMISFYDRCISLSERKKGRIVCQVFAKQHLHQMKLELDSNIIEMEDESNQ